MTLEERIYQDYVAAMKNRDADKKKFLSFIRADLKNQSIDLKVEKLTDEQVLALLKKQQKRLNDTKDSLVSANRPEMLSEVEVEITLLSQYLPKQLAEDELRKLIDSSISSLGAATVKDMGRVMKEVTAKVGMRADAKLISKIVKDKLTN
ncbi:MAG: GatB/YqeY domain-containing protein [Candidatus Omnitrophica bacterium]|nr:GatB/YqeY domain-containing protein [Candidatus Omnitrophota bacterium]